jgi:hypothetical protein
MAALNKQPVEHVKVLFDSAISASRRSGFVNFVGVMNERASLYFLEMNDLEWASLYMIDAFEMYKRWGAIRKCVSLIQDHSELLPPLVRCMDFDALQRQTNTGTFLQGRVFRFTPR